MFTELIIFTVKFGIPEGRNGAPDAQGPGMFDPSYTIVHMFLNKVTIRFSSLQKT
jgi:hypothetical protein